MQTFYHFDENLSGLVQFFSILPGMATVYLKADIVVSKNILCNRDHQSNIFELNFRVWMEEFPQCLLEKFVEYAISHNVQYLYLALEYNY